MENGSNARAGGVYVQTNDAEQNEVVAFTRSADGLLARASAVRTGGRGTGKPHLPSQSSVVVRGDRLLVTNGGSGDVSLLAIEAAGLRLVDREPSGTTPTSIAVHGDLVYVLNNGDSSVTGFRIAGDRLEPLAVSTRSLSGEAADGAQVAFSPDGRTLVVTERGSNSISAFAIDERGYAEGPATISSVGATPYGFDFVGDDALVVTEAFGGEKGKAAASSYALTAPGRLQPVSGSVGDTRSEVCWAAVTRDGRFVYVTNFGDGTISSYAIGADGRIELAEAVAASTRLGEPGVRDEIRSDGRLSAIGAFEGVPETVAGLAAS
jgi:6-phosphogluconolactonase (cycloisomerase 2 family)